MASPAVGAMNFGGRTPAAEAERIVARALERGVVDFDTANMYGDGASERVLGAALKGVSAARIGTKCGIGSTSGPAEGLAPATVTRALDDSLRRLGRAHVDLYTLHSPDPRTPPEETFSALVAAHAAGKIGAWGVSNYASWKILEFITLSQGTALGPPRVSQVIYNLLIRQLDVEYFAFTARYGVSTTVYNPLAGGLLAGRGLDGVEPDSRLAQARYRRRFLADSSKARARAYLKVASDAGLDGVTLGYAWLAQRPGVDTILLGPATLAHLDAGLDACAVRLDKDVVRAVEDVHDAWLGTDIRYAR